MTILGQATGKAIFTPQGQGCGNPATVEVSFDSDPSLVTPIRLIGTHQDLSFGLAEETTISCELTPVPEKASTFTHACTFPKWNFPSPQLPPELALRGNIRWEIPISNVVAQNVKVSVDNWKDIYEKMCPLRFWCGTEICPTLSADKLKRGYGQSPIILDFASWHNSASALLCFDEDAPSSTITGQTRSNMEARFSSGKATRDSFLQTPQWELGGTCTKDRVCQGCDKASCSVDATLTNIDSFGFQQTSSAVINSDDFPINCGCSCRIDTSGFTGPECGKPFKFTILNPDFTATNSITLKIHEFATASDLVLVDEFDVSNITKGDPQGDNCPISNTKCLQFETPSWLYGGKAWLVTIYKDGKETALSFRLYSPFQTFKSCSKWICGAGSTSPTQCPILTLKEAESSADWDITLPSQCSSFITTGFVNLVPKQGKDIKCGWIRQDGSFHSDSRLSPFTDCIQPVDVIGCRTSCSKCKAASCTLSDIDMNQIPLSPIDMCDSECTCSVTALNFGPQIIDGKLPCGTDLVVNVHVDSKREQNLDLQVFVLDDKGASVVLKSTNFKSRTPVPITFESSLFSNYGHGTQIKVMIDNDVWGNSKSVILDRSSGSCPEAAWLCSSPSSPGPTECNKDKCTSCSGTADLQAVVDCFKGGVTVDHSLCSALPKPIVTCECSVQCSKTDGTGFADCSDPATFPAVAEGKCEAQSRSLDSISLLKPGVTTPVLCSTLPSSETVFLAECKSYQQVLSSDQLRECGLDRMCRPRGSLSAPWQECNSICSSLTPKTCPAAYAMDHQCFFRTPDGQSVLFSGDSDRFGLRNAIEAAFQIPTISSHNPEDLSKTLNSLLTACRNVFPYHSCPCSEGLWGWSDQDDANAQRNKKTPQRSDVVHLTPYTDLNSLPPQMACPAVCEGAQPSNLDGGLSSLASAPAPTSASAPGRRLWCRDVDGLFMSVENGGFCNGIGPINTDCIPSTPIPCHERIVCGYAPTGDVIDGNALRTVDVESPTVGPCTTTSFFSPSCYATTTGSDDQVTYTKAECDKGKPEVYRRIRAAQCLVFGGTEDQPSILPPDTETGQLCVTASKSLTFETQCEPALKRCKSGSVGAKSMTILISVFLLALFGFFPGL